MNRIKLKNLTCKFACMLLLGAFTSACAPHWFHKTPHERIQDHKQKQKDERRQQEG
jgi:hypothetical protein